MQRIKVIEVIEDKEKKCTSLVPSVPRKFQQGIYDSCRVLLQWEIINKKSKKKILKSFRRTIKSLILGLIFSGFPFLIDGLLYFCSTKENSFSFFKLTTIYGLWKVMEGEKKFYEKPFYHGNHDVDLKSRQQIQH